MCPEASSGYPDFTSGHIGKRKRPVFSTRIYATIMQHVHAACDNQQTPGAGASGSDVIILAVWMVIVRVVGIIRWMGVVYNGGFLIEVSSSYA